MFSTIIQFCKKHFIGTDGFKPALFLLLCAIFYYIFIFSWLSILNQYKFFTGTHDVGLYDQAIWLLSSFKSPQTAFGINLFGVHVSGYSVLLAPLFWLWSNINMLYIVQSVLLPFCAIPLFLYANKRLNNSFLALAVGLSFLLYPALQNMNMENFHPEALTVFFLTCAIYFMLANRFNLFYPFFLLSIIGKEEMGFVGFLLGFYLLVFRKQWKHGAIVMCLGLLWYLVCVKLIMPFAYGISILSTTETMVSTVYSHWFISFANNIFNPEYYYANIFNPDSLTYFRHLFEPLLYLPLLSPAILIVALPSLALNILSGSYYLRSIFYHYNYVIISIIFFAFIDGLARINRINFKNERSKQLCLVLLGLVIICQAIIYNTLFSVFPFVVHRARIKDALAASADKTNVVKRAALKIVPAAAKVSASYSLFPHLSHRDEIYMFPNPFIRYCWSPGISRVPAKDHVDYVVIDWVKHGEKDQQLLLHYLRGSPYYDEIYDEGGMMILQRKSFAKAKNSGANYVLYQLNDEVSLADDFSIKLKTKKTGTLSMLYFPLADEEFMNIMGEEIPREKKMALEIFGYLFIPEKGEYRFNLSSKDKIAMKVDGALIRGPVYLKQGFHKYLIRYLKDSPGNYGFMLTVLPPKGREHIISDYDLFLKWDARQFQSILKQYKKKTRRYEDFIEKQKNIIINGGFEVVDGNRPQKWQILSWQAENSFCSYEVESSVKKKGRFSAKLMHQGLADSRWVQKVEVEPSTRYKLSAWLKTDNVASDGAGAYVALDELGSRSEPLFGTHDWQYVEVEMKTRQDQNVLTVLCRFGDYGVPNSGTAYFDEIILKKNKNNLDNFPYIIVE